MTDEVMTDEELLWTIAYGENDEGIPIELCGHDVPATLFKMIRVIARELLVRTGLPL